MSFSADVIERLPEELRWARQWCITGIAGPDDKAPYSVKSGALYHASVTDPSQWLDFEEAVSWALRFEGAGIGYVLHEQDPYSCIDLDVKDKDNEENPEKWSTQQDLDRYWRICKELDSYTELSRSGKGLHIWVRGKIGAGKRRQGVEIYSRERFIICTGNIINNKQIEERQELLTKFVDDILQLERLNGEIIDPLEDQEATSDDAIVFERALNASNADKFVELCKGDWKGLDYPSQSEADLALMSMFTFYSRSNEQCKRLFRMTELGKREKAVKNDRYLDTTIEQIRKRQAREEKIQSDGEGMARALVEKLNAQAQTAVEAAPPVGPQPPSAAATIAAMVPKPEDKEGQLQWPPGFTGAIANFIYGSSTRPIKAVSIVAALGFIAGICGRTWLIPQSGLNIYLILVAKSGIGKEAMHSGISLLINKLTSSLPGASSFFDFSEYASGPALTKAVAANPCFVNICGEWGRRLKRLSGDDRDSAMQALRTVMTNLYQKSGPSAIVGGIRYSNKDDNIASVSGVSFSMIGETTPKTYYESLTESMMEDGFLSRFTIIEYDGKRPPHNENQQLEPDAALIDHLKSLVAHSIDLQNRPSARIFVQRTDVADELIKKFDVKCDDEINATEIESYRQMWNRASLKVQRIAALLAVADNPSQPWILEAHVKWALDVIQRDIAMMMDRLEGGDIGSDDNSRELKMLSLMREYILIGTTDGYKIPKEMREAGIIPRRLIQIRLNRVSAFLNYRAGANMAIDLTIKSLIDSGYLMECEKGKISELYGPVGKCYRILDVEKVKKG